MSFKELAIILVINVSQLLLKYTNDVHLYAEILKPTNAWTNCSFIRSESTNVFVQVDTWNLGL